MPAATPTLTNRQRVSLATWIGERPATTLAIHALRSGTGRVWFAGKVAAPRAVLVESALVPGEPQGFGDPHALFGLLDEADGWGCIELDDNTARAVAHEFELRWGKYRTAIDVVHVLATAPRQPKHPLVRQLTAGDLATLDTNPSDLLLDERDVVTSAAEQGRVFGAVDGSTIVGIGASFAAGRTYADVGVHVSEPYREQGIATAAAALACRAVRAAGLTPVWGAGSHNDASLRVAAKLGFVETERLVYLVPEP